MKIFYITDIFPVVSETFISSEIYMLENMGVDLAILSLLDLGQQKITHVINQKIKAQRFYSGDFPYNKIEKALKHIKVCVANPVRYWNALHCTRIPGLPPRSYLFKQLPVYASVIRNFGATHIHSHFGRMGMVTAWMLGKLIGVPFSVTLHGSEILVDPYDGLGSVLRSAALVVCVSKQIRSIAINHYGVLPERVHVVRCGIDPEQFTSGSLSSSSTLKMIAVARMHPVKGLCDLIEACLILKRQGHMFTLKIVGDGSEREKIDNLIKKYGLSANVHLYGSLANERLSGIYNEHQICVLPSYSEGVPVTLMEAMASGLAVVATDVGGVSELVETGKNGLLVQPKNPEALAAAIVDVHSWSNSRKKKMSEDNRKRIVYHFNRYAEAHKLLSLFNQLH